MKEKIGRKKERKQTNIQTKKENAWLKNSMDLRSILLDCLLIVSIPFSYQDLHIHTIKKINKTFTPEELCIKSYDFISVCRTILKWNSLIGLMQPGL